METVTEMMDEYNTVEELRKPFYVLGGILAFQMLNLKEKGRQEEAEYTDRERLLQQLYSEYRKIKDVQ